jgi:GTP-binding protein Era
MPKKIPQIDAKSAFKSGFITLIGRSSVGKSTLLNSLVGTKLAIVTHRPQTTRNVIHGVLNSPDGQAVFIDTPGIFREKGSALSSKLIKRAEDSLEGVDVVVYVVDPAKSIGTEERYIMSLVRKIKVPKILVINKSDLPAVEKKYLDDYLAIGEDFDFVFQLSALFDRHVEPLRQRIFELLPAGEPLYPPDQITNTSSKFWISEIIREKLFLALREEVPYTTHVEIEELDDKPDVIVIKAIIFTYDSRYKKMIIGARGRQIKEIGIAARKELEVALNKKVFLELEVEKDARWEERV